MAEKKLPIDYESILGPEFLNVLSRIEDLEEMDKKVVRDNEMKTLNWDSDISSAKRESKKLSGNMTRLKSEIISIKETFINIVEEFKMNSSKEDFDKLKRRIDDWNIEKFLTREEFERMLKEA